MIKILKPIDAFLNSITMYRSVLYGLIIMSVAALILGAWGILPYSPIGMVLSLAVITSISYASNKIMAYAFCAVENSESWLITAFILFLLLKPVTKIEDTWVCFLAAVFAMASKYLLAIKKKHVFNPVAVSVFILSFMGYGNVLWWVGSKELLLVVVIVGLLVVRKIRRFHLFFSFLITSVLMIMYMGTTIGQSLTESFLQAFTSWPVIFFGTIMLTEPLTTPPTKEKQIIYGGLVGILFGARFAFGPVFSTPQLALLIGNVVSYLLSSKQKLFLTLKESLPIGTEMYEFIFKPNMRLNFVPGQYLEWTLPNVKLDSRGNRRYFTIASSPTEEDIKLGVRVNPKSASQFKHTLLELKQGQKIIGAQLAGDFTLPADPTKKLVFIAGGIGVTPFRSMVKYLLDKNEKRDIVMFYTSITVGGFVYQTLFDEATTIGLKMHYLLTTKTDVPKDWQGKVGYMTKEMVISEVPDYKERTFYLSGPSAMVDAYKELLLKLGVTHSSIVTDYFPGF